MSLFTPIIGFLHRIKLLPLVSVSLILLWLIKDGVYLLGISLGTFSFYILGALLSLNKVDISAMPKKIIILLSMLYIPIILIVINSNGSWSNFIMKLCICIGIAVIVGIVSELVKESVLTPNKLLVSSAFYLYLTHPFIIPYIRHFRHLLPQNDFMLLFAYAITPIVTILILLVVFVMVNSKMPSMLRILTGGRS